MSERRSFATALARDAGALACRMRGALGVINAKDPLDFCTEADHAVEQLVRDRISVRFGEAVLGEEGGGEPASRLWVVDPIDGTTNFIHGTARWCVSLAYVVEGRVELGVICAPAEDRLFVAEHGSGAWLNDAPIHVSGLRHGAGPVIEVGWSSRRPIAAYAALIEGLIAADMEFRRHGSGALGMADVAAGVNDAYVELHINAWDVLAGLLLVQEAGGWTNDYLAGDGLTRGNPIVACTPELRQRLMGLTGIR
ncbi:MAG TPA: inositol monophosphatase [Acetobacteraceae bacterium]|nr:inositol monophosphatase [Acetobacteraceae bacterium]